MSAEVHQVFFREFTAYCSRVLFPMHVYHPKNTSEFRDKAREFGMAGFPNCVHDSDGCVFNWPGCPAGDKNQAKSFKGNAPAVNCLLTWDHRHLVLSYTLGMGTMTDENLQPLDPFPALGSALEPPSDLLAYQPWTTAPSGAGSRI